MNADGSISATHARKYKQICHLATLCEPVIDRLAATRSISPAAPLRALDLACGNAYLSFVLAEVLRLRGVPLRLHGVDVRADVVARSIDRARALGLAALEGAARGAEVARDGAGEDRAVRLASSEEATGAAVARAAAREDRAARLAPSEEATAPGAAVARGAAREEPAARLTPSEEATEPGAAGAETERGGAPGASRAARLAGEATEPGADGQEPRLVGESVVGLSFAQADIAGAARTAPTRLGGVPDLVLALHACDTATDEAIALAIELGVPALLSVPCCQAELAAQLARAAATAQPLAAMVDHGLLRRAYADVLTDSLRVAALEACGYDVTVLEFVGGEHTPKNLLIKGHRRHPRAPVEPHRWRLEPLQARCAALGVQPDLLRRLAAIQAASPTRG
nr:methyltransferase [Nannocystis sp. ILAH1]